MLTSPSQEQQLPSSPALVETHQSSALEAASFLPQSGSLASKAVRCTAVQSTALFQGFAFRDECSCSASPGTRTRAERCSSLLRRRRKRTVLPWSWLMTSGSCSGRKTQAGSANLENNSPTHPCCGHPIRIALSQTDLAREQCKHLPFSGCLRFFLLLNDLSSSLLKHLYLRGGATVCCTAGIERDCRNASAEALCGHCLSSKGSITAGAFGL